MNVLMTTDAVGGVWTYAMDLCAALASDDVSFTLATMGPRPNERQRNDAALLDHVRLVESDFKLEWMPDPWSDVERAGDWLLQLAEQTHADVVHLNGYTHAALPWRCPVLCVAHSCVSSWWQGVYGSAPPSEWATYERNVVRGLNSADRVVAPTHAFLRQLCECHDLHAPTLVIHNGRASRAHWPASSGRLPMVFACGRPWDLAKNLGVLDVVARDLRWPMYVAGNIRGPDERDFSATSLHMLSGLPSQDVHQWLSRASVFVHPAVYEPFGLAVLEAAAAGCALVLADIPTLRELWDGAAEFFDPRDSGNLRFALDALIADPKKRQRLSAAAEARAEKYGVDAMAQAYLEVYRSLTDARRNASGALMGQRSLRAGMNLPTPSEIRA